MIDCVIDLFVEPHLFEQGTELTPLQSSGSFKDFQFVLFGSRIGLSRAISANRRRSNANSKVKIPMKCQTCGKQMSDEQTLKRHNREVHETDGHGNRVPIQSYPCPEVNCRSLPFKRKSQLLSHMMRCHNSMSFTAKNEPPNRAKGSRKDLRNTSRLLGRRTASTAREIPTASMHVPPNTEVAYSRSAGKGNPDYPGVMLSTKLETIPRDDLFTVEDLPEVDIANSLIPYYDADSFSSLHVSMGGTGWDTFDSMLYDLYSSTLENKGTEVANNSTFAEFDSRFDFGTLPEGCNGEKTEDGIERKKMDDEESSDNSKQKMMEFISVKYKRLAEIDEQMMSLERLRSEKNQEIVAWEEKLRDALESK